MAAMDGQTCVEVFSRMLVKIAFLRRDDEVWRVWKCFREKWG